MRILVRLAAFALILPPSVPAQHDPANWKGVLRDAAGQPVAAQLRLRSSNGGFETRSNPQGQFEFRDLAPGSYTLSIVLAGAQWSTATPVEILAGARRTDSLRLTGGAEIRVDAEAPLATGGEQLSGGQVSALPLNKRDFSQLLLLAAGTQTDTNGAANFTQQFTSNGQRGTTSVFAMDGVETTDPEMGGATFSNFNVDAIQEIQSSSGALPAEIGHGAAGFTMVVTRSGANELHGSFFEFVRNAAFDARNFFDRNSIAQSRRIPAFTRNEFGFTNGGPLRRGKTYYFVQYQGFRQVLGTTQVLPVPSLAERQGKDTTAFPGDVLTVPVDSRMASVLAQYPLPNDPGGPYGERTYATSSKVRTVTNQFSARIDHKLSAKGQLFARFNWNNVEGPVTNPSQTVLDHSFGIPFFDHQRNFGLTYTRAPSAALSSETSIAFNRATPNFPTGNHTQPALNFADGLYEAFNAPAGSVIGAYGNLFQLRQNITFVRRSHTWKAGAEVRYNRDTTIYGTAPNGSYTFGGGAAYSPVEIRSQSGLHDIHTGDLLPDALTGFLTATPFSYTVTAAPPTLFAQGARMGNSAVRRTSYNFYLQDTWKVSPRLAISYGLRYELNTPIAEGKLRTSGLVFENAAGQPVDAETPGARVRFLINPQPIYPTDRKGWAPRLSAEWRWNDSTVFRAGATITGLLTNLWQSNYVTGGLPYVVAPYTTATPGHPIPLQNTALPIGIPTLYDISGQPIYASGKSTDVPPNTEADILRFERDLAALTTDKQVRPVTGASMARDFHDGYIATYTAGLEHALGDLTLNANYVATVGIGLPRVDYPNGYGGADSQYAPYSAYGPIALMTSRSHSTYHSLQASVQKSSLRAGLGFQASYTYSRSLDDTSTLLGGFVSGSSGTILQTAPQDPRNQRAEKGPSTFDIPHAFSISAIQQLPIDRLAAFRRSKRWSTGWQLLALGSVAVGAPFTVYSGIQQTGAGSNGSDRPDQIARPEFSTGRQIREDYFGRGGNNASYFAIPIDLPGGAGPNAGRFGSLGRNTFRGPGFRNVDLSLVKDTPIGRGANSERVALQFRAEVFNAFNLVNFGLPANTVLGPGFGVISRTAGTSRQIQLSLKLLY